MLIVSKTLLMMAVHLERLAILPRFSKCFLFHHFPAQNIVFPGLFKKSFAPTRALPLRLGRAEWTTSSTDSPCKGNVERLELNTVNHIGL